MRLMLHRTSLTMITMFYQSATLFEGIQIVAKTCKKLSSAPVPNICTIFALFTMELCFMNVPITLLTKLILVFRQLELSEINRLSLSCKDRFLPQLVTKYPYSFVSIHFTMFCICHSKVRRLESVTLESFMMEPRKKHQELNFFTLFSQ